MFYFAQHDIYDINELKQLEISKRNKIIEAEKSKKGVTVRQLSRITGITKSVIDRTEGQCTCPLVPPPCPVHTPVEIASYPGFIPYNGYPKDW
ncbi:hypothetical protein [Dehalobacterium formicoaceticum]|uniref:hypothetical protein n=1 Tax=Dehalobacterium formicoaceticum TaxID=51515 RepID=UPI0031F69267